MVFLREGGKDDLSILLERKRLENNGNATASSSTTSAARQVSPAVGDRTLPTRPSASPGHDNKGKRKADASEPTDSLLHRLAGPSTGKAGLKRDPNEVRQIIYQSSKGGHYFNNEERKDEKLTADIQVSLKKLDEAIHARGGDLRSEERRADWIIADQESRRDLSQCIVVVDCDAFYASVEELDNPSLKGKAFGVGEGVLTTASYEARKFGCRSAMPGYIAKKLCPELIFVKPDFTKYSAASKKVMDVLERYDPEFSPASLDEAYMNLTLYLKKTGMTSDEAIRQLREEVKHETGLTVSAGCGPNTMLAKIAADFNKPDGHFIVDPTAEACKAFMQELSVRKIPGIGRINERWLEAFGIMKCKDIYTLRGKLLLAKGESGATSLLRSYLGMGNNKVERGKREDRGGIGHETTFSTLWRYSELDDKLKEIATSLAEDMDRLQYSGRTVTLKLKLETYEVLSRSHTPGNGIFIHTYDQLYKYGKHMLDNEIAVRAQNYDDGKPVKGKGRDLRLRLMGLKVSNLRDDSDEAAHKVKGKGSLFEWASKANSRIGGGQSSSKSEGAIDLTMLDSDEEDEDGNYDEIAVAAAPCPLCHKTVAFEDDAYAKHVETCSVQPLKVTGRPEPELIDLSLLSSQEDFQATFQHAMPKPKEPDKKRSRSSTPKSAHSKDSRKAQGKQASNAFSRLMKEAKKKPK